MAAEARRGRWIPLVYYYLAAVVGLTILLVGITGALYGLTIAAFPQISPEARFTEPRIAPDGKPLDETDESRAKEEALERARLGGVERGLRGLIAMIVGGPVFFWHLRQARRREPEWLGIQPGRAPPS